MWGLIAKWLLKIGHKTVVKNMAKTAVVGYVADQAVDAVMTDGKDANNPIQSIISKLNNSEPGKSMKNLFNVATNKFSGFESFYDYLDVVRDLDGNNDSFDLLTALRQKDKIRALVDKAYPTANKYNSVHRFAEMLSEKDEEITKDVAFMLLVYFL